MSIKEIDCFLHKRVEIFSLRCDLSPVEVSIELKENVIVVYFHELKLFVLLELLIDVKNNFVLRVVAVEFEYNRFSLVSDDNKINIPFLLDGGVLLPVQILHNLWDFDFALVEKLYNFLRFLIFETGVDYIDNRKLFCSADIARRFQYYFWVKILCSICDSYIWLELYFVLNFSKNHGLCNFELFPHASITYIEIALLTWMYLNQIWIFREVSDTIVADKGLSLLLFDRLKRTVLLHTYQYFLLVWKIKFDLVAIRWNAFGFWLQKHWYLTQDTKRRSLKLI